MYRKKVRPTFGNSCFFRFLPAFRPFTAPWLLGPWKRATRQKIGNFMNFQIFWTKNWFLTGAPLFEQQTCKVIKKIEKSRFRGKARNPKAFSPEKIAKFQSSEKLVLTMEKSPTDGIFEILSENMKFFDRWAAKMSNVGKSIIFGRHDADSGQKWWTFTGP